MLHSKNRHPIKWKQDGRTLRFVPIQDGVMCGRARGFQALQGHAQIEGTNRVFGDSECGRAAGTLLSHRLGAGSRGRSGSGCAPCICVWRVSGFLILFAWRAREQDGA